MQTKCSHGYYLDANGQHIMPTNEAVSIHDYAKKHTMSERVQALTSNNTTKPKCKRTQELEQSAKDIKNYYATNPQYRPLPRTIFDPNKEDNETTKSDN